MLNQINFNQGKVATFCPSEMLVSWVAVLTSVSMLHPNSSEERIFFALLTNLLICCDL